MGVNTTLNLSLSGIQRLTQIILFQKLNIAIKCWNILAKAP